MLEVDHGPFFPLCEGFEGPLLPGVRFLIGGETQISFIHLEIDLVWP
jgi:hypothetical protein